MKSSSSGKQLGSCQDIGSYKDIEDGEERSRHASGRDALRGRAAWSTAVSEPWDDDVDPVTVSEETYAS